MPSNREGFTVRVLRSGSAAPAGVGFVVDDHHIVTCAHVVNTALGRDQRDQVKPDPGVRVGVDFPMLEDAAGAPVRSCRVEAWLPPPEAGVSGGDLAGLVLVGEGLPKGGCQAQLAEHASRRDPAVDIFGYPDHPPRQEHGAWAAVHLRGPVGGGLIQLDSDSESAIRAQPGYSGSPMVAKGDRGDEVLGMLAVASRSEGGRDAYAIPVTKLANSWPDVLGAVTVPECPYRGLEAFTAEDAQAGLFVGREEEIAQLREMVRDQSLVVVTGPSGVGKSSLVNAGLVRVLRDERWVTRIFQPGSMPFEALARTVFSIERPDVTPTLDDLAKWVDRLRSDGLATAGSQLTMAVDQPILLCVDQFEQVLDPDICTPAACAEFLDLLLTLRAPSADRLRLVCTLRADFLSQLLEYPDAGAHLRDRLFALSPMGRERMERVITEPAEVRGVRYQSGLAALIAREAGDGRGLPLLGFTLAELWPQQQQRQVTFAEYHSVGGVMGALSAYAERILHELLERFPQDQLRRVMLTLVRSRGGASEATRRVVARERLGPSWAVAEALAKRRLVVVGHDFIKEEDNVQIAHEALIREWPRLATWVDDDADFQHWLTALEERVADRDLLPDTRIAEADRWLAERGEDIPYEVRQLIEHSKSEWLRRVTELEDARNRAEEAARQAEARRLAAAAELALASREISLQIPIALAVESLRMAPVLEADIATRHAIRIAAPQISRLNHDHAVSAVAFSPDGTRVATGSRDGTARVFDVASGTEISRLDHDRAVGAVAFSPDGTRVATGSSDASARVFDVASGTEISRLDHDRAVGAVAFSPDGTRVATGSSDASARVFDAASGTEISRLNHLDAVSAVAFSPDGSLLATASSDASARIFDAATSTEVSCLNHDRAVGAVAFSPDGTRVATGSSDARARIFDTVTGVELNRLNHRDAVSAVAFSPDGSLLAIGSRDGSARVFDAITGTELSRLDHGEMGRGESETGGSRVATGNHKVGACDRSIALQVLNRAALITAMLSGPWPSARTVPASQSAAAMVARGFSMPSLAPKRAVLTTMMPWARWHSALMGLASPPAAATAAYGCSMLPRARNSAA